LSANKMVFSAADSNLLLLVMLLLSSCHHHLCPSLFVRLRNDLYCVGWGVKLYSISCPLFSC